VAEKTFAAVLTDRDRIMARITTGHGGTVEHYSLQFECRLGDSQEWTAIRRYDSSHGVVHVHVFRADGSERRVVDRAGVPFKEGLRLAWVELSENWQRYRRTYEEG